MDQLPVCGRVAEGDLFLLGSAWAFATQTEPRPGLVAGSVSIGPDHKRIHLENWILRRKFINRAGQELKKARESGVTLASFNSVSPPSLRLAILQDNLINDLTAQDAPPS